MRRAPLSSPRGYRLGAALAVAILHLILIAALVRAFAPDFTTRMAQQVFGESVVTVTTHPPEPPPPAAPAAAPQPRVPERVGAAAPAGKRAKGQPNAVASPRIVIAEQPAPSGVQASGVGTGARDVGSGTGAQGQGSGTGAGVAGSGAGGGGAAAKAVKTAGDINSARDYPPATREQRLGDYVTVALIVGTDGRVKSCRVHRASRDPQSDQITCRLAQERFRFRPATDAAGNPVESVYGWQQRWFEPKEKN